MELKDVKHQHFVDYTINRCKITTVDGKIRTIGFSSERDEFGKIKFIVDKKDEKYCVV